MPIERRAGCRAAGIAAIQRVQARAFYPELAPTCQQRPPNPVGRLAGYSDIGESRPPPSGRGSRQTKPQVIARGVVCLIGAPVRLRKPATTQLFDAVVSGASIAAFFGRAKIEM